MKKLDKIREEIAAINTIINLLHNESEKYDYNSTIYHRYIKTIQKLRTEKWNFEVEERIILDAIQEKSYAEKQRRKQYEKNI